MIPAQHHRSLAMLGCAALLLMAGLPVLHWAQGLVATESQKIEVARQHAVNDLQQLQANIATARELAGKISEEQVVSLLAPVDRLKTAGQLERLAQEARLSHFTYTIGAERKDFTAVTGEATPGLTVSTITLSADAPLDTHIYDFLDRLQLALSGRLRVAQMTIDRPEEGHRQAAAAGLHWDARLDWLSNGAVRNVAGVP